MANPGDAPPPREPNDLPPAVEGRLRELCAELEGTFIGNIEDLSGKLDKVADAAERIHERANAEDRLLQGVGRVEQASAGAEASLTGIHRGLRNYRWLVVVVLTVWTAAFAAVGMVAESEFGWAGGLRPETAFRHQAWEAHGAVIRKCHASAKERNEIVTCGIYAHPPTSAARQ